MRQQIKIKIPRRLGKLMEDETLDKITLCVDQYDIILELIDESISIPQNQNITVFPKKI